MTKTKDELVKEILSMLKVIEKNGDGEEDDIASLADDLAIKEKVGGGMDYAPNIDRDGEVQVGAEIDADLVEYNNFNIRDLSKDSLLQIHQKVSTLHSKLTSPERIKKLAEIKIEHEEYARKRKLMQKIQTMYESSEISKKRIISNFLKNKNLVALYREKYKNVFKGLKDPEVILTQIFHYAALGSEDELKHLLDGVKV